MRSLATIAALFPVFAQAESLDRIAATVAHQVITESAVILDLRVGAFLDRGPIDLSPVAKRRSAERLVDQVLILTEATESHLALPTAQSAAAVLEGLKPQFGSPQEYQAALKRYGIDESDLAAQLLTGLIAVTFSELRFRPAIQLTEEDLRAYYNTLDEEASFEDSRDQIEQLLTQQLTSEALDQWLITARVAGRVQFREKVFQ